MVIFYYLFINNSSIYCGCVVECVYILLLLQKCFCVSFGNIKKYNFIFIFQNVCQILWCLVKGFCRFKLDVVVDGTRCGEKKVMLFEEVRWEGGGYRIFGKSWGEGFGEQLFLGERRLYSQISQRKGFRFYYFFGVFIGNKQLRRKG